MLHQCGRGQWPEEGLLLLLLLLLLCLRCSSSCWGARREAGIEGEEG